MKVFTLLAKVSLIKNKRAYGHFDYGYQNWLFLVFVDLSPHLGSIFLKNYILLYYRFFCVTDSTYDL